MRRDKPRAEFSLRPSKNDIPALEPDLHLHVKKEAFHIAGIFGEHKLKQY